MSEKSGILDEMKITANDFCFTSRRQMSNASEISGILDEIKIIVDGFRFLLREADVRHERNIRNT